VDEKGNQTWYFHWKEHRDGAPAYVGIDGTTKWFQYGKLHRDNGDPAVVYHFGDREWWQEGQLHREGAPAIERNDGTKEWYAKGKLHRDDGPAIERPDGKNEFWRDGERWNQGASVAPQICEEKKAEKEKQLEAVAQTATIADEEVKILQPIKFKKAPGA
jgi:hypothetical protein